jgi:hypothetical protein
LVSNQLVHPCGELKFEQFPPRGLKARETALSVATIRRAEPSDGQTSMTAADDLAVRRALEMAGVEFIDENGGGPGLRLRKRQQPRRRR